MIAYLLPALIMIANISPEYSSDGFGDEKLLDNELKPLVVKLSIISGISQDKVLSSVFGDLRFEFIERDYPGYSCWSTLKCYGSVNPLTDPKASGLLVHELGHRFLNDQNLTFAELDLNIGYWENGQYVHVTGINPQTGRYERTALGFPANERPYMQHPPSVPITGQTYQEDFADMFMAWALDRFSDDVAGQLRYGWMDDFVRSTLKKKGTIKMSFHPRISKPITALTQ